MKKVLISIPHNLLLGGVQNYILNLVKHLDLTDLTIDIYFSQFNKNSELLKQFTECNVNIIFGNNKDNNRIKNIKNLKSIMKKNKYDVIHINTGDLNYQVINLILAKLYKIKIRIAHSHNAVIPKYKNFKILHKIKAMLCRFLINIFATEYFACSKSAGNWMYGKKRFKKKGKVQNNGIDYYKYKFDPKIRTRIRQKYLFDDNTVVIGLIAYFNFQKNHSYLIDIFNNYNKKNPNSKLLLIGDGELKNQIQEKVEKLKLSNSVIFLESSTFAYEYYSAMDCFIMTSIFEGLPFVGIEAQISGLPCLFSNSITEEVKLNDNVVFLDINHNCSDWSDFIYNKINELQIDRRACFDNICEILDNKGYNINQSSKIIRKVYLG